MFSAKVLSSTQIFLMNVLIINAHARLICFVKLILNWFTFEYSGPLTFTPMNVRITKLNSDIRDYTVTRNHFV